MLRKFSELGPPVIEALETHLAAQFDDAEVARAFAEFVVADVLRWTAPLVACREVKTIVAYAFGNRIDANGNRSPGPVNEALAGVVTRLHEETGAQIYAQWEIAEAISTSIRARHVTSIAPRRNARAETVYLSTGGVAAAVVDHAGGAERLGKVAVVGVRDHIKRCVDTSLRVGMDAAAPAGYDMPEMYDVQSGQPWTRSRLAYMMHDVYCRAEDRRDQLVGTA